MQSSYDYDIQQQICLQNDHHRLMSSKYFTQNNIIDHIEGNLSNRTGKLKFYSLKQLQQSSLPLCHILHRVRYLYSILRCCKKLCNCNNWQIKRSQKQSGLKLFMHPQRVQTLYQVAFLFRINYGKHEIVIRPPSLPIYSILLEVQMIVISSSLSKLNDFQLGSARLVAFFTLA